jgi:hypothetical protein
VAAGAGATAEPGLRVSICGKGAVTAPVFLAVGGPEEQPARTARKSRERRKGTGIDLNPRIIVRAFYRKWMKVTSARSIRKVRQRV